MLLNKQIYLFSLLFLLFMPTVYAADPTPVTPLPTPIGRVVWVNGSLSAVMPNNEKRELQKTSIIYLHDTLITAANSQAEVVLSDKTLMTFKENTKFTFDKYEYVEKSKSGSFISRLTEGGFRTITGLISKNNPDNYEVNTPVATIGVRGTDYQLIMQKGKAYLRNYAGKPCITNSPSKGGKGTKLCLDLTNKYGTVENPDLEPIVGPNKFDISDEQLKITDATFGRFSGRGVTGGGGVTSSFCIMQ